MRRSWRGLGVLLLVAALLWLVTGPLRGSGTDDGSRRVSWGSARPTPASPTGASEPSQPNQPSHRAGTGPQAPSARSSAGIFGAIDEAARRREGAENGGSSDWSPFEGSARFDSRGATGSAPTGRATGRDSNATSNNSPDSPNSRGTNRDSSPGHSASLPPDAERIMLILDASGSMARVAPDGRTSMEAAQEAMADAVEEVPAGTPVGLRVFGSRVDGKGRPTPQACRDTRVVQPLAPLNHRQMTTAIFSFDPLGETPIARSLRAAADDLGTAGRRAILLVSDGEESCEPDPCRAVTQARQEGIDVRIHTVGLRVDGRAREQLRCIARSSGGSYTEAGDEYQLTTALRSTMQRLRSEQGTSRGASGSNTGNSSLPDSSTNESPAAANGFTLGNREAAGAILVLLLLAFVTSGPRPRRRR